MNFKRGNTYKLYCDVEELENIEKLVFAINEIKKYIILMVLEILIFKKECL